MKPNLLALVVGGLVVAGSVARAASPTEKECAAAAKDAEQLRGAGDLFAARGRLEACSAAECARPLREQCARDLAGIEAVMPAVVVEAKDAASNNVTEVRARIDGAHVGDRLDGVAIPVNPGEHRLVLEGPGFRRTETTFVAHEGQKKLRVVVYLDSDAGLAVGPSGSPSAAGATPGRDEGTPVFATRRQKVALALGVGGVAGVAVGSIWSIMSKMTYDHAVSSECGGDVNHCSPKGIADGQTAHQQAAIATVGFVAAGALLAAGAVVYFTGREHTGSVAIAPAIDGGGGVTVAGRW
jgi:hypothetical protein